MNLNPRAVPRELNLFPRGRLKATRGIFEKSKPKATSEAKGLATDVAKGLPEENFKGGLQSTLKAHIEFSRNRPRAQIHLATPSACPQIVPGLPSYKMCQIIHQQNLDGVLCNIMLESRKEGDIWMDFTQMMEECQYKDLL